MSSHPYVPVVVDSNISAAGDATTNNNVVLLNGDCNVPPNSQPLENGNGKPPRHNNVVLSNCLPMAYAAGIAPAPHVGFVNFAGPATSTPLRVQYVSAGGEVAADAAAMTNGPVPHHHHHYERGPRKPKPPQHSVNEYLPPAMNGVASNAPRSHGAHAGGEAVTNGDVISSSSSSPVPSNNGHGLQPRMGPGGKGGRGRTTHRGKREDVLSTGSSSDGATAGSRSGFSSPGSRHGRDHGAHSSTSKPGTTQAQPQVEPKAASFDLEASEFPPLPGAGPGVSSSPSAKASGATSGDAEKAASQPAPSPVPTAVTPTATTSGCLADVVKGTAKKDQPPPATSSSSADASLNESNDKTLAAAAAASGPKSGGERNQPSASPVAGGCLADVVKGTARKDCQVVPPTACKSASEEVSRESNETAKPSSSAVAKAGATNDQEKVIQPASSPSSLVAGVGGICLADVVRGTARKPEQQQVANHVSQSPKTAAAAAATATEDVQPKSSDAN